MCCYYSSPSGVVVAVKGSVSEEGFFHVNDIVYAGEETQPLLQHNNTTASSSSSSSSSRSDTAMTIDNTTNRQAHDDDTYLLLVSGLQVGAATNSNSSATSDLSVQLLMDFVSGRLGGAADVALASKIVRVVVAGNSVVETTVQPGKERFTGSKHQSEALAPMRQVLPSPFHFLSLFFCPLLLSFELSFDLSVRLTPL